MSAEKFDRTDWVKTGLVHGWPMSGKNKDWYIGRMHTNKDRSYTHEYKELESTPTPDNIVVEAGEISGRFDAYAGDKFVYNTESEYLKTLDADDAPDTSIETGDEITVEESETVTIRPVNSNNMTTVTPAATPAE